MRAAFCLIAPLIAAADAGVAQIWLCPMHPEVRATTPGRCPECSMPLVAFDRGAEQTRLNVTASGPVIAGQPVELRLEVIDARSGARVQRFTPIHDRPFHLFVLSEDLASFDHVHPDLDPDGGLRITLTLPRAGRYQLVADFLPEGGLPQVVQRALLTRGPLPALAVPKLTADRETRRQQGPYTLELEPVEWIAGQPAQLRAHLVDTRGTPVALSQYLSAWAHVFIASADLRHTLHAHADRADPPAPDGGPSHPVLAFSIRPPEPGTFRLWIQVQVGGEMLTFPFTVEAKAVGARYLAPR